jgi:imidazolonepropionase-like amidohydrolase
MLSVTGMVLGSPLIPTNPMPNILKRLDIIKNAIAIEDEELIELQISKITAHDHDAKVTAILNLLARQDFARAVQAIEQYLADCMGLMVYVDKALLPKTVKQGRKVTAHLAESKGVKIAIEAGVDEWAHTPCDAIPDALLKKQSPNK